MDRQTTQVQENQMNPDYLLRLIAYYQASVQSGHDAVAGSVREMILREWANQ